MRRADCGGGGRGGDARAAWSRRSRERLEAQFIGQSPYLTPSGGDPRVVARGPRHRQRHVDLRRRCGYGTTDPRDRQSSCQRAATSVYHRAAHPARPGEVAPGQDQRLRVGARAQGRQHDRRPTSTFAPVADGYGGSETPPGRRPTASSSATRCVPRQPPMARISSQDRVGRRSASRSPPRRRTTCASARRVSVDGKRLATDATKPTRHAGDEDNLSLGLQGPGWRRAPTTAPGSQGPRTPPSRCLDYLSGRGQRHADRARRRIVGGLGKRTKARRGGRLRQERAAATAGLVKPTAADRRRRAEVVKPHPRGQPRLPHDHRRADRRRRGGGSPTACRRARRAVARIACRAYSRDATFAGPAPAGLRAPAPGWAPRLALARAQRRAAHPLPRPNLRGGRAARRRARLLQAD